MARIQVTSNFTDEELKTIEKTAAILSLSKYKLIRAATLKYCEECLKHDRETRGEGQRQNPESDRGIERATEDIS
jgi:hypothetical protein